MPTMVFANVLLAVLLHYVFIYQATLFSKIQAEITRVQYEQ